MTSESASNPASHHAAGEGGPLALRHRWKKNKLLARKQQPASRALQRDSPEWYPIREAPGSRSDADPTLDRSIASKASAKRNRTSMYWLRQDPWSWPDRAVLTSPRRYVADIAAGPNEAEASPSRRRLSGPVQFIKKLLEAWRLEEKDAASLLGLEPSDLRYAADLLAGRASIEGRDAKDRIAYLFLIRATLDSLLRDEDVENDWLRAPHAMLDDKAPMTLLLEGSMENLLLVKEYVEVVSGR